MYFVSIAALRRNDPPRNKVRDEERENAGDKEQENSNKSDDGRIGIEHFTDAATNTRNFLIRFRSIKTSHGYTQKLMQEYTNIVVKFKPRQRPVEIFYSELERGISCS